MSTQEKLLAKLARKPAPNDFRWVDLITLMEGHGFKVSCSGGSHHRFLHASGYLFRASKTHPSGLLLTYQIKDALGALNHVSQPAP